MADGDGGVGGCTSPGAIRPLQGGRRETSQECFAPKAASPRTGRELRLPLAAEQTP